MVRGQCFVVLEACDLGSELMLGVYLLIGVTTYPAGAGIGVVPQVVTISCLPVTSRDVSSSMLVAESG